MAIAEVNSFGIDHICVLADSLLARVRQVMMSPKLPQNPAKPQTAAGRPAAPPPPPPGPKKAAPPPPPPGMSHDCSRRYCSRNLDLFQSGHVHDSEPACFLALFKNHTNYNNNIIIVLINSKKHNYKTIIQVLILVLSLHSQQ